VTSVFQHEPKGKTQIDLMPDEQHFAVRITGMPDIWTIAASTGPVIALTPPRAGRNQRGAFDWANVVRHEFVHTVTLDRTANRLPHWFTEGAAVSQELTGRSYDDCQLLTWAVRNDELFRLDEINWGFIRPESKRDRPLAYAQAHWFIEYLTTQHGHAAVLKLMRLYNDGVGNVAAMEKVTGRPADAFFNRFKAWARAQVRQWGLARTLGQKTALNLLAQQRGAQSADEVVRLWAITGRDPDALKQKAKQRMARLDAAPRGGPPGRYAPRRGGGDRRSTRGKDASPDQSEPLIDAVAKDNVTGQKRDAYQAARKAVMQYAEARPVDPWTDRALARLALRLGRTPETVGSLKRLDRTATRTGQWAWQLARLHRRGGRMSAASGAIQRALDREPYNASYRALAATLALQQSDHEQALHHLKAMARLEPKEAIHHVRLAALLTRMGQRAEAEKHARQARKLNPDAPVGRFLSNAE
jgi:tetratricopeptide (TPR) repeat protein